VNVDERRGGGLAFRERLDGESGNRGSANVKNIWQLRGEERCSLTTSMPKNLLLRRSIGHWDRAKR